MSDSRTHVEIEDVLSSIRRLVSQDGQAARRPSLFRADESPLRPSEATPQPEAADCLVLTPALRVAANDPQMAAEPAAAGESAHTLAAGDDLPQEDASASARDADLVQDPWHADVAQGQQSGDEAFSLEAARGDAPLADSDSDADADAEDEQESGLVFAPGFQMPPANSSLSDELSRLESTIAELEAAVAASDEAFEPEHGDPFAVNADARGLADAFGLPPVEAAVAPDQRVRGGDAAPPAEAVEWVDPVDPAEAELTASDWAGEEADSDAAALADASPDPRRLHLADAQTGAPPREPTQSSYTQIQNDAADDLMDDEAGLFGAPEDAVIDEESLRTLVSEIIRQELQGTLGERITRSVRKLVRREISRALASRDFE